MYKASNAGAEYRPALIKSCNEGANLAIVVKEDRP